MERKSLEIPRVEVDLITGPQGRRALAMLLNQTFQVPEDHSFLGDFPIWDEMIVPSSEETVRLGAFSSANRELMACTGVRLARLKTPTGALPVALIGAVATGEAHRGAGLASGLVSLATDWAQARGAAAVFLWGSEYTLYQRLGFELCGAQVMIPLEQISLEEKPVESAHAGWDRTIFQRMKERAGGLALGDSDERWLASHRCVQWYWTGTSQKCDAYVAIGRGIDLQHIIHEWGGEPEALRSLLSWLKAQQSGLTLLGSPTILKEFGIAVGGYQSEFLCLAHVIQFERVVRAFKPSAQFSIGVDGDRFRILTERGTEYFTRQEATHLIFGPLTDGTSGKGLLFEPLPLWFWGLDAV